MSQNRQFIIVLLLFVFPYLYVYFDYLPTIVNNKLSGEILNTTKTTAEAIEKGTFKSSTVKQYGLHFSKEGALFNITNFKSLKLAQQNETPIIPHIIHQQWDSKNVPKFFYKFTKSIARFHPKWEYWFWTLKDAECLLKKHYPSYLDVFNGYESKIQKADALRYFVLYHYGGVYMDLDNEALKPIDLFTYNFPAVLSNENLEHSYIIYNKKTTNVLNHVLASRPKHPFFKQIFNGLIGKRYAKGVLNSTGPFLVQDVLEKYHSESVQLKEEDTVLIIHPKYWLPQWDKDFALTNIKKTCANGTLFTPGKAMCNVLQLNGYRNNIGEEAFLNHHWSHIYFQGINVKDTFNIRETVPHVKFVSSFLSC